MTPVVNVLMGVFATVATAASPVPMAFVAATENVYAKPFVRPVTDACVTSPVSGTDVVAVVHVEPASVDQRI